MGRCHLSSFLLSPALFLPLFIFPAAAESRASWSDGMMFLGDATVKNGVLSLTSDESPSPSSPSSTSHSIGRALYSTPLRFLNPVTGAPLSFSSRFTFSITALSSKDTFSGDGLALLITSDPQFLGCADGYIGLFCDINATSSLQGGRETVGVEFDAWFNSFFGDLNSNHVAIDLGNISSVASADAGEAGVDLRSGAPVTAWVEYDFAEDSFRVWISGSGGTRRPPRPLLRIDRVGLAVHLREFMYVGFSASSSGRASSAHLVESWSFRTFAGSLPSSSLTPTPAPIGPPHGGPQPAPPLQECLIRLPLYQVASADMVKSACTGGEGGGDNDDWPRMQSFPASPPLPRISRRHRKNSRHGLIPLLPAICLAILLSVLVITGLALGWNKKKMGRPKRNLVTTTSRNVKGLALMRFPLDVISQATGGFHESKILGRGAIGTVYGGVLPSYGAVAVKRFDQACERVNSSFFRDLAAMTGSIRHDNLVPLQGWCCERNELLLVYEYMPNGNLAEHLHPSPNTPLLPPLTWGRRWDILLGLASAVAFLHGDCEPKIIHRGIKSCNVLLDAGFNARLADMGLGELRQHVQSPIQTMPTGTVGYLAPELVHSGVATEATDVYSFGIVALEVGTGRKPLDKSVALVDWVWELYGRRRLAEAADPRLRGEFDSEEMSIVLTVGLACAYPDCRQRPSMRRAIRMLRGEIPAPVLPPKKPAVRLMSLGKQKLQEISAATSVTVWHTPEHSLI